jgi:hypothetical protein
MSAILERDVVPPVPPGTANLPGQLESGLPAASQPGVTVDPQTSVPGTAGNEATRPRLLWAGNRIMGFWNGMVSTLAVAFLYGLFWCMAAAIYLLLRRDVDEIELDEVFVDEDSRTMELPPLRADANGIPQIQPLDENEPPAR